MFKMLSMNLFAAVICMISTAQAGFYDGRIPKSEDLVDEGFWYCSENEDFKPPTDAKGVAAFIKNNPRPFKFEKTDMDETFRNIGESTNQNFTVNTKVDGLAVVHYIKATDVWPVETSVLKAYEILRIEKNVLTWVFATEDEKGSSEYDPVNFRALKNGRIKATQKCLSEKTLKDVLVKNSGCTIRQVIDIFDTANFFKDVNKMASQKKDPNCRTCGFDTIVTMGEKWANGVSCKPDKKVQEAQQSTTKGKK